MFSIIYSNVSNIFNNITNYNTNFTYIIIKIGKR